MVIESRLNSLVVFAGAEGVVLKSDDLGQSFRPVLEYPISGGEKYPVPPAMLLPAHSVEEVLIGGFDKAVGRPYLARTRDDGTSWEGIFAPGGVGRARRHLLHRRRPLWAGAYRHQR